MNKFLIVWNHIVAFVKAHWVAIVSLGIVLYAHDKPYIDTFVSKHAWASVVLGNLAVVWAWYQTRETFDQKLEKQVKS